MLIFGFGGRALPEIVIFFARGNSLSQNLTVLPAPSEREPLARPQALHFSQKLCRHAKGPIPEGAVAVGDWGSSGKHPFRLAASRQATFPKGTALAVAGKFAAVPKGVPERDDFPRSGGRCHRR